MAIATRSSTERRIQGGFAAALACLVTVGIVAALSVARSREERAGVEHTWNVITQLEALLTAVVDTEAAQRGYLLTGSDRFLPLYSAALKRSTDELQHVRALTVDNPSQQARLAKLTSMVAERAARSAALIEAHRGRGVEEARRLALLDAGELLGEQIRRSVLELQRVERDPLAVRTLDAQQTSNLARRLILGDGVLALAIGGLALFAIRRDFAGRQNAERALQELNEQLEQRVRERTAELPRANAKQQTQLAQLALLSQITRAIGERPDVPNILQVVVRTVEEHFPVDFACMCFYDAVQSLLTVASVGNQERARALGLMPQSHVHIDENRLSTCVAGRLVYEPDVSVLPFALPRRMTAGGLCSLVAAPLNVENKVFGVLLTARATPNSFSSSECEFLRQLSEHVGLAVHQAKLHGALQDAYDELRQNQRAILQQERLMALGQMASGVAHDINNAISQVSLYTESLLERESNLSPQARNQLETIRRAIDDVAHTVARMREFYRQRESQECAPVELNRLVPQVIDLTRARWSDMAQLRGVSIELRTELEPKLPVILGIESELREALINLVFNAVDAMPEGGRLVVRTCANDNSVMLEVADSGVGMDEDTRRRCLEPFFTTKGERGTGLGLAMVYGSMQRHGADVEIDSALGQGTTIRLRFAVPPRRR